MFKIAAKVGRSLSSQFALSKWLTYRPSVMSRLRFEVIGDVERTVAPALGLFYDQHRFENGQCRSRTDMAIEALAYFESRRVLDCGVILDMSRDHKRIIAAMKLDLMQNQNWISVPPLFMFSRYHGEGSLPRSVDGIKEFFRAWDYSYLNKILVADFDVGWFEKYIFKHTADGEMDGLPWVSKNVDTLLVLCCRSISTFNRIYAGDALGKYTVQSCENLYPNKIVKLISKFNKPTIMLENPTPLLSRCLFKGLNRMYRYMGMTKHFGTLKWRYHERDVMNMSVPKGSSAGIRAGKPRTVKQGAFNVVITPNGTKGDQEKACKTRVTEYIEEFYRTQDIKFIEKACTICCKVEVFNSSSINVDKRDAFYDKCREFFIPHFVQYIFAFLVLKDRQLFERGRMIKVGMRWLHGGAQFFADQMKYRDSTMRYGDGDFTALDTTIHRVLLELYQSQSLVYYDEEDSPDFKLFIFLLQKTTGQLSVKMVHIFARIWKLIIGVMPSGAFQTSHGNSWIVGLLFFAYYEMIIARYPYRASQLEKSFDAGRVEFPDYGDDHVIATGVEIHDIVNENGYASFVKEFFGMEITKIRNDVPFLSIPDGHGGVSVNGVVFLKRRFILSDESYPVGTTQVVPYKLFDDTLVKFAYGNSPRETLIDYCISCIGLAYDNMGVNPIVHEMCENLFLYCTHLGKFFTLDTLREEFFKFELCGKKDITRLLRKVGISKEQLFNGFPTRKTLLSMHKYDKDYVDFSPPVRVYSATEMKRWENDEVF